MATGLPPGFSQYTLPAMGQPNREIFDLLKSHFSQGGPDAFKRLLEMAGGKGEAFSQLEVPARRDLESNLANIGMQFGLSGSNKSSGFQNAIAGAGREFQENLYGKRADLMQKSIQDVMNLGNTLLKTPTDYFGLINQPQSQGFDLMKLLGPVGEASGDILSNIIGKPKKDASGQEGIDWGNIASSVAKFLPLILAAI